MALLTLGACSTLPERGWPERHLGELSTAVELSPDTVRLVEVPMSDSELTILSLQVDPPALAEHFRDGRRFLELPPGTGSAHLTLRYRVFGPDPQAIERRMMPRAVEPGTARDEM
ncbi:MAG: hypothetical protein IPM29_20485 [Planctomycetes bacterium]|nr:hypothetical protein [Planctomycetota bacterium]